VGNLIVKLQHWLIITNHKMHEQGKLHIFNSSFHISTRGRSVITTTTMMVMRRFTSKVRYETTTGQMLCKCLTQLFLPVGHNFCFRYWPHYCSLRSKIDTSRKYLWLFIKQHRWWLHNQSTSYRTNKSRKWIHWFFCALFLRYFKNKVQLLVTFLGLRQANEAPKNNSIVK